MTIGFFEGVLIIVLIGLLIGFAFRTGYTRGRSTANRPEGERSDAGKHH
ncbi:MAG: hypothetical protein Fur005_23530 [Roseiflexaceae bacterium]